ncbi:tRNA-dihydrouridine(47) synthase [NAD(P)(+)]-like isoform X3 [Trachypithecus francoisi]|uniref:tRNA-dihydrouridine(47) synthase [NAD(P)(+)]-like isoform X3 n=1 Tax=Trachypithecus francoisi TaxID=54180 RepID=UPI00141B7D4A|nr:tRNA-dihydrouridine(47) synthase [NAD(P)(+)]-like isoform X3 [Trachypithecus francoisi]
MDIRRMCSASGGYWRILGLKYLTTKEQFHQFLEAKGQEKPCRETEVGDSAGNDLAEPEAKRIRLEDGQTEDGQTEEAAEPRKQPQTQKRARGQNKGRPHVKPTHYDKNRLCPSLIQESAAKCFFGDRCRFLHDVGRYLETKPADLGPRCVLFETFGRCPYGVTCRFAGAHLGPEGQNLVQEELAARGALPPPVRNGLDKALQQQLRKREVRFERAELALRRFSQGQPPGPTPAAAVPEGTVAKGAPRQDNCGAQQVPTGLGTSTPPSSPVRTCGPLTDEDVVRLRPCEKKPLDIRGKLYLAPLTTVGPGSGGCWGGRVAVWPFQQGLVSPHLLDWGAGAPIQDPAVCVCMHVCVSVYVCLCMVCARVYVCVCMRVSVCVVCWCVRACTHKPMCLLLPPQCGNLPFRRICKRFGADVTCGEMAVCTNLLQGQMSEWALLKRHQCEDIFGVQLEGAFPDTMTKCAELLSRTVEVDFVDINVGCPIDLVYKKGGGCALMNRSTKFQQIVRGMNQVLDVPLTVKIRTGVQERVNLAHRLLPELRDWGVALVTLHGRSREQRYTKLADWQYIEECVKAASPMPLFGNGDILSFEDANHAMQTGVAGIMIARGALLKPWLFTEIKEQRHWDISSSERLDILRDFTSYGLEHWGSDTQGVEKTRRFLLEWLSFLCRYVPVGLLERLPQRINERPPYYLGRDYLETLMASQKAADWIRISEMLLGPVPPNFVFLPKHKANAYK